MAQADKAHNGGDQRPLSPHLQIYTPRINMVMSIVHRITGVGLYVGSLLLVWWLLAAATGAPAYETAAGFFGSWFGMLILFGYTWALMHHMMGGIRHFIWDLGEGFELETVDRLCWGSLVISISATLLIWIVVLI
ncbi:MAG: succinate dehydrogenase, cytochrome b556 subunit [Pseudomonadota bacterium]